MPVRFPVRAHAWVAGQVPNRGHMRINHTLMFLSLSFSSLQIHLKNLKHPCKRIGLIPLCFSICGIQPTLALNPECGLASALAASAQVTQRCRSGLRNPREIHLAKPTAGRPRLFNEAAEKGRTRQTGSCQVEGPQEDSGCAHPRAGGSQCGQAAGRQIFREHWGVRYSSRLTIAAFR